ncbi:hypothetical protein [Corallincola spongiicola]|uniref:Uncharacterized protein n=1 Tax=Corallincola spongiicola TaxID=2520508 RepID=A0ABY1WLZ4_9GAMM|nr:hypothetical protein [Corallincola spongiicola]TAA41822.1 hypothetical protein EXY25_16440 [Corallincola spongiicola]
MVSQAEILVLLLCSGLLGMVFAFRSSLAQIPYSRLLLGSLFAFVFGSVCTAVEHIFWLDFFNFLEHIGFLLNAVLMAAWCFLATEEGMAKDADG